MALNPLYSPLPPISAPVWNNPGQNAYAQTPSSFSNPVYPEPNSSFYNPDFYYPPVSYPQAILSAPNGWPTRPAPVSSPQANPFWTRPELSWPSQPAVAPFQQAAYPAQNQSPPYPLQSSPQRLPQQLAEKTLSNAESVRSSDVHQPKPIGPTTATKALQYPSQLKQLFQNNKAIVYALHLRSFGAKDKNGDGQITFDQSENGTFLSSITKLDELKALGVNTIHLLPINPPGHLKRLGEAGSVYAPKTYHELNPEYDTPNNGMDVIQEARIFVEEAHKRGIHVMVDVPSCASHDLALERPDLIALDLQGNPLVPTNWIDILMFQNGPALMDYYEGFFHLMANQIGVDGFRVDVARARPSWFWDHFIKKFPNHAWLAESYTQEDASPMENIPRDIPETLMKIGFDAIYGQFHIFPSLGTSYEYLKYMVEGNAMLKRAGVNKSFIGSFLTHDDHSLMENGGATMYFLVSGLMATQPWTNPYILDGFTTGYDKPFDIFNFRPRPKGQHPEIGTFLQHMLKLRKKYEDIVTQGLFIPIPVSRDSKSRIIAFARHHQGKTLLVVANKDVNARDSAYLSIPGLKSTQKLLNLSPSYGRKSQFVVENNGLRVDLGPGRFHLFEIDTPELPLRLNSYR